MRKRTLGVVLVAGLAMSGAGAFTNTNTVATSVAGVGDEAVSGISVSDIDYTTATNVAGVDEVSAVAFQAGSSLTGKKLIVRLKDSVNAVLANADNLGVVTELDICAIDTVDSTRASCSFAAAGRADLVDVANLEVVVYDND